MLVMAKLETAYTSFRLTYSGSDYTFESRKPGERRYHIDQRYPFLEDATKAFSAVIGQEVLSLPAPMSATARQMREDDGPNYARSDA